jgi:hypothetical protein
MAEPILGPGYSEKNYLVAELMATQNIRKWVVTRQSAYQSLTNIIELAGGSVRTPEQADNRNLRLPYIPSLLVGAQIKTSGRTSISTTVLRLEFTNATYMGFMQDRIVISSNRTMAKVLDATTPGQITIQLLKQASGNATFQSADFAEGTGVTETSDVSAGVSNSKQTRKYVPLQQENVVGKQRYTYSVTRENLGLVTEIEYKGQPYWQYANFELWNQDVKNSREIGLYNNLYNNETDNWVSGGLRWQILNQGGDVIPYDGSLTENKVLDVIQGMINAGNNPKEIVVLCGSEAFRQWQYNIGRTYLVTAGVNNTIGGKEVKGINVTHYSALGVELKFVRWDMMNSAEANMFATSQITGKLKSMYTMLFMDTSQVPTSNGIQPFISRYYYGQDGYIEQEYKGLIDLYGRKVPKGQSQLTTDTAQMDVMFDELVQLNDPSRHRILEISA